MKDYWLIEARRGHCAFMIGKFYIIHGGINATGYLNNMYALNISNLIWIFKWILKRLKNEI